MRLKEYLDKENLTIRAFASIVGISGCYVHNLLSGRKNPSLPLAKRINIVTKGKVSIEELLSKDAPSRLKSKRIKNEQKE